MTRTLIAGFGNVLRGDDGFGVEVLRRLGERGVADEQVELLDVGTGGIRLAQELITPYDRLIILDATTRGGAPGTVYSLVVDGVAPTREIDMHTTVPSRALEVAQAFGPLPGEIYLVGCEPLEVDELATELTPVVAAAVEEAVRLVFELLARPLDRGAMSRKSGIGGKGRITERQYGRIDSGAAGGDSETVVGNGEDMHDLRDTHDAHDSGNGTRADLTANASHDATAAGSDIAREDELLELLYWFEGEGFAGVASMEGIVRFTNLAEPLVRRTLDRLLARGDVLLDAAQGEEYRLTETGRREAARRFAAEFAPMINQGHGECSDPDCDCHSSEGGAAECHGRAHNHSH